MDLLVVGANGLLGSNLVKAALDSEWTVAGTFHTTAPDLAVPLTRLDIRETAEISRIIRSYDPDHVVNCAALTDVDGCEEEPDAAADINATAPGELASVCQEDDRVFAHVSTDYVFDGTRMERYVETATTNPVQVYGETKLEGERAVRRAMDDAIVTRLSFVYGVHRGTGELTGFPAWVRDQLAAREEVSLFVDQRVTPSRAGQAASVIQELLREQRRGTYHVASRSCVTPYEFGDAIRDSMDTRKGLLANGTQSDLDRPATRPSDTCLDVTKVEEHLGRRQPTLTEDLQAIGAWFDPAESAT